MNFFRKHRNLLIILFFSSFTLASILANAPKGNLGGFLEPIIISLMLIAFLAMIINIALLVFDTEYRLKFKRFPLGSPESLGLKRISNEKEEYMVGHSAKSALGFVRYTVFPLTFIAAFLIAAPENIIPSGLWTFIVAIAPGVIVFIGQEIVFRRSLNKLKFDKNNMQPISKI